MCKIPVLSICCISYNHEKYIRECIEGFLMQKTNFPIEILIFDDASTDKTQEVIKEYASDNKNIITFLQTENQWQQKRFGLTDWLFPAARGKYIALCEGDDYWTDPYKLQKQVDFLEANPDYIMSFHGVDYLKNNNIISKEKHLDNTFTQKDLAYKGCFINTQSVVFKNIFTENQLPYWFNSLSTGDYALFLWLSNFGKINYFPETMAVYRQHTGGTWSVQSDFFMYSKISKNLSILYQQDFSKEIKEGFVVQNRNNLRYVLFELIQNSDWDKINEIRELSNFDPTFDSFLFDHVVRRHLDLMNNSRLNKLIKNVKSIFYIK
jgi:glycosyltransferase involved in cell wall biosynthesis